MGTTAEENTREQEPMTWEEFMSALRQLPPKALPETSASIIRELRGPLPEDDPDFVNVDRH
jgi:hypothetical protein